MLRPCWGGRDVGSCACAGRLVAAGAGRGSTAARTRGGAAWGLATAVARRGRRRGGETRPAKSRRVDTVDGKRPEGAPADSNAVEALRDMHSEN